MCCLHQRYSKSLPNGIGKPSYLLANLQYIHRVKAISKVKISVSVIAMNRQLPTWQLCPNYYYICMKHYQQCFKNNSRCPFSDFIFAFFVRLRPPALVNHAGAKHPTKATIAKSMESNAPADNKCLLGIMMLSAESRCWQSQNTQKGIAMYVTHGD